MVLLALDGCASHSERTLPVRSALDAGRPHEAIALLNRAMDVQSDADLPSDMGSDNALFVLDRAAVQQSAFQFDRSKRDFEAADKAIDMLDLAHGATDTIGQYLLSGSSGKYQAPPYEKLLVNTLDMLNYLELRDLNGARIEARRLAVMQRYISDELHERDNAVLGLGGMLAGLTFEKSDQVDESLRWYDQALEFSGFRALRGPVLSLLPRGQYRSPRLEELARVKEVPAPLGETGEGELLLVVGYGRVPHKIAQRVPIGLALTWYANAIAPRDVEAANLIAAQGLVTWINFPTLGPEKGGYDPPWCTLDGNGVVLEEAVDVTRQVRAEWKKIEGAAIVSAITRMVARYAAGKLVGAAAGDHDLVGALLTVGTQATLAAFDTPDTRSWETLPARVAIARVRVPAGRHAVRISARGIERSIDVDVDRGNWAVVSLMALR
jgi:tetratricopeptide (TPR) repeat protein